MAFKNKFGEHTFCLTVIAYTVLENQFLNPNNGENERAYMSQCCGSLSKGITLWRHM